MKSETLSQTKLKQIQKDKHQRGFPHSCRGQGGSSQILHAHLAAADVRADEASLSVSADGVLWKFCSGIVVSQKLYLLAK